LEVYFRELVAWILALSGLEWSAAGKSKLTSSQIRFFRGNGRMLSDTETLQQSMDWSGSISSQAASLARILAALESAQESTANEAAYGPITLASLGKFDPDSYSLRTSQVCLTTNQCDEFLGTFPALGLMRNGECYELQTSALPMNDSVSSLLPTPTRAMGKRGWGFSKTGRLRYSPQVYQNAAAFGYKPPIWLLEWEMGLPRNYTDPAANRLETP
jgi:hypothetical protein